MAAFAHARTATRGISGSRTPLRVGLFKTRDQLALASLSIRFFSENKSTDRENDGMVLGVLRETYNPWERRAPLTPPHVRDLLQRLEPSSLSKVIVQPASQRIFTDNEYANAGAVIQEDLSSADLIIGVKRPLQMEGLMPQKAYMFFSHVIKGQTENMPLLQYILDNKIQLFDYECIVEGGMRSTVDAKDHKQKRLVAFGRYAGLAGMVNTFQALGRRLLAEGYSTPFLNVPLSYMHYDIEQARNTITELGSHIAREGLPPALGPLVFGFTGKGGNVQGGALEMFKLLPHEMITSDDLVDVRTRAGAQQQVYGLILEQDDMVRPKQASDAKFDVKHYRDNPGEYEGCFHVKIAPFINVLVNCMYWDERYPRLLTKDQLKGLHASGNRRLFVVGDISCDLNGSIEFLERTTSAEQPFYQYNPILGEVSECLSPDAVSVMGLDILPTELPRESSTHFGNALVPLLEKLCCATKSISKKKHFAFREDPASLPPELSNACIALEGELTPNFKYIESLLNRPRPMSSKVTSDSSGLLWLEGHLFDSGLINQVLDVVENHNCNADFLECHPAAKINDGESKSTALLRIDAKRDNGDLIIVKKKVEALVDAIEKAEATIRWYGKIADATSSAVVESCAREETVVLLGSGRVSKSFAEYIGRTPKRNVIVVGDIDEEARKVAAEAKRGHHIVMDVSKDPEKLKQLIQQADVVVSLLPARMHASIAETCIDQKTDFVTASYESEEMRMLGQRALDAGVSIINEVGLDPGLDHMSAMRIIDDIHSRGGTVDSFSSVCGGLPAPEAANNALMYKFSWSPMGVLTASQNSATYLVDGEIVSVDGYDLLSSAKLFEEAWPTLHLECLPNRNSLVYMDKYNIEMASSLFRGTLRYCGFSAVMEVFKKMGLLEQGCSIATNWNELLKNLQSQRGGFDNLEAFVLSCAGGNIQTSKRALDCLRSVGLIDDVAPLRLSRSGSIIESFCRALGDNLSFEHHERDMVLMHTGIQASFEDGSREQHHSRLQLFGTEDTTAMCKTVGYTCASATDLLLSTSTGLGKKGLLLPTTKDIYNPILGALDHEGISFIEDRVVTSGSAKQASS